MRNILYVEYKYLKFSQFQKGDITLVGDKVFIKLSNRIIEVCSFSYKNLIITPLYILYYFDISFVPFWENVLYKKDFKKDYLLKRIDLDNKHIQCMLDPYNKEYIGDYETYKQMKNKIINDLNIIILKNKTTEKKNILNDKNIKKYNLNLKFKF